MLLPAILLYTILLVVPLSLVLVTSFAKKVNVVNLGFSEFTLDNYINVFTRPETYKILYTTFSNSLLTCAIAFLIGFPFSYFLVFYIENEKLKSYVMSLLIVPFLIDSSLRTIIWIPILGENGLVNITLSSLGIISEPLKFLYSTGTLQLVWVQTYVLFMAFPIYLALGRVDRDLIDAARVLKAPPYRAFYDITFKLSLPGVICGWIFVFVATLGDNVTPLLIGGGIQTLGVSIANYTGALQWGIASVLSATLIIIAFVVLFILLKIVDIKKLIYTE